MKTKSVLILGGSGFLGTHLALTLREECRVYLTYNRFPPFIQGTTSIPAKLENRNGIKRILQTLHPDVFIYAAGSSETTQENSQSIGPSNLMNMTEIMQTKFIFLSNSYVFNGEKGNYSENDMSVPNNPIGKLKSNIETVIRSKCLNYVIIRASPLYGKSNGINLSFIDHLRMKLGRGELFHAQTNEIHSFAPVRGICNLIQKIIHSGFKNKTIHYSGLTKMTHFAFAQAVAHKLGYNPAHTISQIGCREKEVLDFSLNCSYAVECLKIKPFLLEEGLDLI